MKSKMKNKWLSIALLTTFAGASFAGDHSGVRGGGHVIEVNGNMELVDIVTTATCDWYSGKDIIANNPSLVSLLKRVETLDWYLATELKREIEYITWCMTGNLYSVPAVDDGSFVQQLSKGVQQAAFRYNDSAYIDQSKFDQLSPASRAYLILHEALHSYLPMELEMRRFKLMSLVSTLRKVDLGQITSREKLHLNIAQNEMNFPLSVARLEPFKKSLAFIFSSLDEQMKTVLNTQAPESLVSSNLSSVASLVAAWDVPVVRKSSSVIKDVLKAILIRGELTEVRRILQEQSFKTLNPAAIGLSVYEELNEDVQKEIMRSGHFLSITQEAISSLHAINVSIVGGRIVGDLNLLGISDSCASTSAINLTSLVPMSEHSNCSLPGAIQGMVDLMIVMNRSGETKVLKDLFIGNQDFINAFTLRNAFASLDELNPPIQRELPLAKKVLSDLQGGLVAKMKSQVLAQTGESSVINQIFNQLKNK